MRIKFKIEDLPSDIPDSLKILEGFEILVEDFPCRLTENDMVTHDVLGENFLKLLTDKDFDYMQVKCSRFDKDEKGFFQEVWLHNNEFYTNY